MKKIALIILTALTFASCEKLENGVVHIVEFPERDPMISTTLIASDNDSLLHVHVSSTANVIDSAGPQLIQDAVISIENSVGTALYSLSSDDLIDSTYILDLGQTLGQLDGDITLKVSAPEFEDVEATTSMPSPFSASVEYYPNADTISMWGMQMIQDRYIIDLENTPGIHESYLVEFEGRYIDGETGEESEWISIYSSAKPDPRIDDLSYILDDTYYLSMMMVSDETAQSDPSGLHQLYFEAESFSSFEGGMELIEARVRINSLSPELESYYRNVSQWMNNDISLFAEPMLMYSNVSSGFGCFGLSNELVVYVDID